MSNSVVDTPRLYIPRPDDGPRVLFLGPTFGRDNGEADGFKYAFLSAQQPNKEVLTGPATPGVHLDALRPFYDLVAAHYDVDLLRLPPLRPYLAFVDYVRSRPLGLCRTDFEEIKELRRKYNVIIEPDDAAREYLEYLYSCVVCLGRMKFSPLMPPPARFARYVNDMRKRNFYSAVAHARGRKK